MWIILPIIIISKRCAQKMKMTIEEKNSKIFKKLIFLPVNALSNHCAANKLINKNTFRKKDLRIKSIFCLLAELISTVSRTKLTL